MPSDELDGQVQRASDLLCHSRETEVSCRITQHGADSSTSIYGSQALLNAIHIRLDQLTGKARFSIRQRGSSPFRLDEKSSAPF